MSTNVWAAALLILVPYAYGDMYDGSPGRVTDTGTKCSVWADHMYDWSPLDPPRNNHPLEMSLYPGDMVYGRYTWGSGGCCRTQTVGPAAAGTWSDITGVSGGSYIQNMAIVPDEPVPGAVMPNGFIHMAEYDGMGRSRTHTYGTFNGTGLTAGTAFTISGYIKPDPLSPCNKLDAAVTLRADFRYRNPFWQTSIYEHHIITPDGYPASNLDHTQYRHDAIPLEAGSDLTYGAYRQETIRIAHHIKGGDVASEFHCDNMECPVNLPAAPATISYMGHTGYSGDARNPPWPGTAPHLLNDGEAIFSVAADKTTQISIISTMYNTGREITRGYNSTYQFVSSYDPVFHADAITNTAAGGNTALERPISVIVSYNGTISDTLHYCSVGVSYDTDGTIIPVGSYGTRDRWGRAAGDTCPGYGEYGTTREICRGGTCSYVVYPPEPKSYEWGRLSAVNPETRAVLYGFEGAHTVCGLDECTTYDTPYLNWDYVPDTDRQFIPACVVDIIAAEGGPYTNVPKPDNWGIIPDWGFGQTIPTGSGASSYSYRGVFEAAPDAIPYHYVVDKAQCEDALGERECVPRGGECLSDHDRRCEDVFTPFTYPDDYIISHHDTLQTMVAGWCGTDPSEVCVLEAYQTIYDTMADMCTALGVRYDTRSQTIDMSVLDGNRLTPAACHAMVALGVYVPVRDGAIVLDWRDCRGECRPAWGGTNAYVPYWDGRAHLVYVPYTPTTGAFGGMVERPGSMLAADGTITCACTDADNDGICDSAQNGTDLDGNGIVDDWDSPLVDGTVSCLDRTGRAASAMAACWSKYGRDSVSGGDGLAECLADVGADGPDGRCDPALVAGTILDDGTVLAPDRIFNHTSLVPFVGGDGIIPVPYVVNGTHMYCNEAEPWCVSSGDTYQNHTPRRVCEEPGAPHITKRIPAPSTIPPLYHPVFDEKWPPACLPYYPVAEWERPPHPVSLDVPHTPVWPTGTADSHTRTPSHIGMGNSTMFVHAGTGVVRFDVCAGCRTSPGADGWWNGTMLSRHGDDTHRIPAEMRHPPFDIQQEGRARATAVEPCDTCDDGWRTSTADISLTITSYPEMHRPVTTPEEMVAHICQTDGDGGSGMLGVAERARDMWNQISCRDGTGISITIQDYEAARHGDAAKRESSQPWTVATGHDDVSVDVYRSGIWLSTMSILEHRGECMTYDWSSSPSYGWSPGMECGAEDDTILLYDVPAYEMDYNSGGTFACKEVAACKSYKTLHKCLGGIVTEHVTCVEPEESFSVLDMPYEEVLGSVGTQKLHIEAVCPAGLGPSGCNGIPIYDTHTLSAASSHSVIYVDYYGVGVLDVYRTGETIHVRPPATFGPVHHIVVNGEPVQTDACTACVIRHGGAANITVYNVYGGELAAYAGPAPVPYVAAAQTDDITGAVWLYMPALAALAAGYIFVKKISSRFEM